MNTLICPRCGCSLVRLEISKEKSAPYTYNGEDYYFCCQACADLFATEPETHLERVKDLIVCPTFLGENLQKSTFTFDHSCQEITYFCCPHCQGEFEKDPDHYIKRLEGTDTG